MAPRYPCWKPLPRGTPVIVPDIPGNREWVTPGENGWLFPDGDAEALAAAILNAVDQRQNLPEMGKKARQLAEARADWEKISPSLKKPMPSQWDKYLPYRCFGHMTLNKIAIIQARMSSSRLPGKVLMDIAGRPMLQHVIVRTMTAKSIDAIVVATTTDPSDDVLEQFCHQQRRSLLPWQPPGCARPFLSGCPAVPRRCDHPPDR